MAKCTRVYTVLSCVCMDVCAVVRLCVHECILYLAVYTWMCVCVVRLSVHECILYLAVYAWMCVCCMAKCTRVYTVLSCVCMDVCVLYG